MTINSLSALQTSTDLSGKASKDISATLNLLLADVFTLYFKTKNFHWHLSGAHFRDFHLLFDEQATQIYLMTDAIAERVRKVGGRTIHSIGEVHRLKRILDNDADFVTPLDMIAELREDNQSLTISLRQARNLCEEYHDYGSTSKLEAWIDESEQRSWFLYESSRRMGSEG